MLRNILTILIFIGLIAFSHWSESATEVKPKSDSEFSALNAYEHLKEIAKAPHPIGSTENLEVRDYVANFLRKEGLEVEIMTGYTRSSWKPSWNKMAYVENVVATLRGSDPSAKKIILAGHYDSVMEGPGAADDGYSVACMMETARLLKSQNRKNDLILLITDGEEYGLLGAQYYIEQNDMKDIGVVLNYEARGAEGPGIAFEWSDDNGWLVDEMSKCYERPIANSLSYEIYKRMPNGSDFSEFMLRDVPGINHAFIDGFSYYHHPQDDLEHVSKNSIQHTGENMYLAAKHFTNFDFSKAKKGNASFFNFYGLFINYSSSLDLFLFILSLLFAAIAIERLNKDEAVNTKRTMITFLWLLLTLILCVGLCFGLSTLVKVMYPQYATFYSHHWYNHEWYLISGIGLVLSICWLAGRKLISKYGAKNITSATILLLTILSTAIHFTAPSGTYIMMYPLMAVSLGAIAQEVLKDKESTNTQWIIGGLSLALIIGLWTVFSHSLYLAFSLNALAAAVLPTILFCFASQGLLSSLWQKSGITLGFGLALFLATFIIAHLKAKPTEEFPIKTNLFYAYEGETDKTFAATFDRYIHEGHVGKLDGAEAKRLPRHMQFSRFITESDIDLSAYLPRIQSDTIPSKKVTKTYYNPKRAAMQHLYASEISNIDSLFIDGQLNKAFKDGATGGFYSPMYGIGLDSMVVTIVKRDASVPTSLYINTQYREMPLKEALPVHVVRNDGLVYVSTLEKY